MRKIFSLAEVERTVQTAYSDISINPERRLVFMVAIQAYLDMLLYKKHLETALKKQSRRHLCFEAERQYRYSVVFFLHPLRLSGQSYAGHLFSVVGMDSLLRKVLDVVRRLEAEIKELEKIPIGPP